MLMILLYDYVLTYDRNPRSSSSNVHNLLLFFCGIFPLLEMLLMSNLTDFFGMSTL